MAAGLAFTAALLAAPGATRAQHLGNDTIALFPKNVGEFAYANLKQARTQKWFPNCRSRCCRSDSASLKDSSRRPALTRIRKSKKWHGLDSRRRDQQDRRDGSNAVPTGEEIVGVALGSYNPDSTEAFFKAQKLPTFKSHGFTMYAFGSGAGPNDLFFLFIDSNTAAFGHRAELEKMLNVRYGGEEGLMRNDNLFPLINETNGSGAVWAVLNPAYTRLAMKQLAPQIQQFPEAAKLVTRMQNLLISVQASGGVDGKFQAVCGSTDDANTLAQLLQLALVYQQYQAKQQNQDLSQLLGQAQVTPGGDRVTLRMSLSDDQMAALIKKNTFALKM